MPVLAIQLRLVEVVDRPSPRFWTIPRIVGDEGDHARLCIKFCFGNKLGSRAQSIVPEKHRRESTLTVLRRDQISRNASALRTGISYVVNDGVGGLLNNLVLNVEWLVRVIVESSAERF